MDVSQYLEIFMDEASGHLQNLSDYIMILEREPENMNTINEIFRAVHSIKGMAGTMGFKRLQRLTRDMENVVLEVRSGRAAVTGVLVDILFRCLDAIRRYLDYIEESSDEGADDNEAVIRELNLFLASGVEHAYDVEKPQLEEEVRFSSEEKLPKKYLEIEFPEKEKEKLPAPQQAGMQANKPVSWRTAQSRTVCVDLDKLDVLMNQAGQLMSVKNMLVSDSENGIGGIAFQKQIKYLECIAAEIYDSVMKIYVPPALAVIQALILELRDEKYAVSIDSIETIEEIKPTEIKYVQAREVVRIRDMVIPLVRLDQLLDCVPEEGERESITLIIVRKEDKLAGLVVDGLVGQMEIVIKTLGKYMNNSSKLIRGATVLNDGGIALVLDVNTLF